MDLSKYQSGIVCHYGVLGMKWGVRKGRSKQAYERASKKLNGIVNRVSKAESKAKRKMYTADTVESRLIFSNPSKAARLRMKSRKYQSRADKYRYKAVKWINSMDSVLSSTPNSLSKDQKALGERYVEQLKRNTEFNKMQLYTT